MPLNQGYLNRSYPFPDVFDVGRHHIRSFALAVGDDNPVYHSVEAAQAAGHRDLVAPPSFLTVLDMWYRMPAFDEPEFGLDWTRIMHSEQRFVLHRPVWAGDRLLGTRTITKIRALGPNETVEVVSEIVSVDGDPVAEVQQSLVSRGTAEPRER